VDGSQLGVISLPDAINMARAKGVDLVEIAPNATPPVCRLVDYGKFRYEQAKKEKESKKHHHANKVKEVQLSPSIDPHDFGVKLGHAIDFLCEEMKVKISLRFRGREMAHKEFGFQKIDKFIKAIASYGHPDSAPKLIGKGVTVMLSPLPRNKRGKNPRQPEGERDNVAERGADDERPKSNNGPVSREAPARVQTDGSAGNFANNPFAEIDLKVKSEAS
jgi:translation initiation factor IF-3